MLQTHCRVLAFAESLELLALALLEKAIVFRTSTEQHQDEALVSWANERGEIVSEPLAVIQPDYAPERVNESQRQDRKRK